MHSLRARLSAAFIAIAVLTTVLTATFATYTARSTFREYVEHTEHTPAGTPGRVVAGAGPVHHPFGVRERLFSSRIRNAIWGGTFVAAGVGVLVALWLTYRIGRPVTDLTRAARTIASGRPAPPVPVRGNDEIAELGRAFNVMAAQLAEDEAQRRRLFAAIAHELRTPLSVVQGTLEGMLDRVIEPTPERIAAVHSQILLLRRLITDLRDLSLAQAGQLQLHIQPVDVAALVRETAEALHPLFEERGIVLRVDGPDHLPPVEADPDRLRQVVQNLLENAIHYTPAGGRVGVALRQEGGDVRMEVGDTGIGISAEDLPHVFEHFYRADRSRARSSGGMGLGLAIVKSLVEAHRGRIAVESTPGAGSRFTVRLPVHAWSTGRAWEGGAESARHTQGGAEQSTGRPVDGSGSGSTINGTIHSDQEAT
jgi:two-component system sensor histidine kinase BaeS